jgi:hypothetical protein
MLLKSVVALVSIFVVARPVDAVVKSAAPNGFEVATVATIAAPPERVYAAPGEGLRLRGALGPLQTEGVDGTLSWTLKHAEGGTTVTQSYVVGGYIRAGMESWAARVDRVLDEQLQRLKSFVEGKSPTQ